jgi:general secretion pathway protein G
MRKELVRQAAFTLIELMVVIVIIGLLAGIVVPNYFSRIKSAEITRMKADMKSISDALKFFKMDCGTYPESLEKLYAQPQRVENWHGPYLDFRPRDPWGGEYIYQQTADMSAPFVLKSYGPDEREGGEGEDGDYSSLDLLR